MASLGCAELRDDPESAQFTHRAVTSSTVVKALNYQRYHGFMTVFNILSF